MLIHKFILILFLTLSFGHNAHSITCAEKLSTAQAINLETKDANIYELEALLDQFIKSDWRRAIDDYRTYLIQINNFNISRDVLRQSTFIGQHIDLTNQALPIFRINVIKALVEETIRTMSLVSLPIVSKSRMSAEKAQNGLTTLNKELFRGSPVAIAFKERLATWVGFKENLIIKPHSLFPIVPESVEGEYWDFATGVIPTTLSGIKGSDPNRVFRYFDISTYVTVRINHLLKSLEEDNRSVAMAVDLNEPDAFKELEGVKLAGIRIIQLVTPHNLQDTCRI